MEMLDEEEYKVGSPDSWHQTGKSIAAKKANDAAGKAKGVAKASAAMGGGSRLAQAISGAMASSKASTDAYTSGYDTGLALAQQQEQMKKDQAQWREAQELRNKQFEEGKRQFNVSNELAKEQLQLSKDQLEETKRRRGQDLALGITDMSLKGIGAIKNIIWGDGGILD